MISQDLQNRVNNEVAIRRGEKPLTRQLIDEEGVEELWDAGEITAEEQYQLLRQLQDTPWQNRAFDITFETGE